MGEDIDDTSVAKVRKASTPSACRWASSSSFDI